MRSLKSNLITLSLIISTVSCQTNKTFHLKSFQQIDASDLHVIQTKSTYIQQKCLYFNAETENNWRHQYFIYLRRNKNEFFEIMQPTHQDKETCDLQAKQVKKILSTHSDIQLCVRGEMKKALVNRDYLGGIIEADSLSEPLVIYQSLTLDSICSNKKCFSNNKVWGNTCPGFVKQK